MVQESSSWGAEARPVPAKSSEGVPPGFLVRRLELHGAAGKLTESCAPGRRKKPRSPRGTKRILPRGDFLVLKEDYCLFGARKISGRKEVKNSPKNRRFANCRCKILRFKEVAWRITHSFLNGRSAEARPARAGSPGGGDSDAGCRDLRFPIHMDSYGKGRSH